MAHGLRVICRPEVAPGFALTGLPAVGVPDAQQAGTQLRAFLEQPEVGVVLIEQGLHDALPDDVRRRLARRPLPMVVPFPGPTWARRADDAEAYIVELLRQVIGYRVRLR